MSVTIHSPILPSIPKGIIIELGIEKRFYKLILEENPCTLEAAKGIAIYSLGVHTLTVFEQFEYQVERNLKINSENPAPSVRQVMCDIAEQHLNRSQKKSLKDCRYHLAPSAILRLQQHPISALSKPLPHEECKENPKETLEPLKTPHSTVDITVKPFPIVESSSSVEPVKAQRTAAELAQLRSKFLQFNLYPKAFNVISELEEIYKKEKMAVDVEIHEEAWKAFEQNLQKLNRVQPVRSGYQYVSAIKQRLEGALRITWKDFYKESKRLSQGS